MSNSKSNLDKLKEADKHSQMDKQYDSNCLYKGEKEESIEADSSVSGYLKNHLFVVIAGSAVAGVLIYKFRNDQMSQSDSFVLGSW